MATPNEPQGEFLDTSLDDRLGASLQACQVSMIALYEPFNHIVSNHRYFDPNTLLELQVKIQELMTHIIELSQMRSREKVGFDA
tara:strand:- start:206 stop:457 length:252 start_codon:yes stop_codon:yes gene_type:complete